MASLAMPPRFHVAQIGRDHVIGVWRDELEVQHVRVYGLRRR
ncbi:MAG TPA: hypothetical protein VF158_04055 [Longimicrobiales bacterium]